MIIAIIIICCIIIVINLTKKKQVNTKKQPSNQDIVKENISATTENDTLVFTLDSEELIRKWEHLSEEDKGKNRILWEQKEKRINVQERRQCNHRNTYIVFDFINSLVTLLHSEDFYVLERNFDNFENILKNNIYHLTKTKEYEEYSSKAIRLYNMRLNVGLLQFELNDNLVSKIKYPNNICITEVLHDIEHNVFHLFEAYWANVLSSYKRKNAYINRLNYLVDYIEGLKKKEYISQFSDIISMLSNLQDSYQKKLL